MADLAPNSHGRSRPGGPNTRRKTHSTQGVISTDSAGIQNDHKSAVYEAGTRSRSHTNAIQASGPTPPEQKMESSRTSGGYTAEYAATQAGDTLYEQLTAMHQQKERALMKSVNHLKQKVAYLQAAQREDKRSRYIQKLTKESHLLEKLIVVERILQLRKQQKTNEILKRNLTTMTELTPQQIDDMLLKKGVGAPKRFATAAPEEDQERLADLKQRCSELEAQNNLLLRKNEELSNALYSNYRSKLLTATSRGSTLPSIGVDENDEEPETTTVRQQRETTQASAVEKSVSSAQTKTLDFTSLPSLFPQDEIEKLEQELSEKEAKVNEQYDEIAALKRQAEEQNKHHEKLKNKYQELKQNKRKEEEAYERKLYYAEQRASDLEVKVSRAEQQINSLKHQLNANEETIKEQYASELESYKDSYERLEEKYSNLLEKYYQTKDVEAPRHTETKQLEAELDYLRKSQRENEATIEQLKQERNEAKSAYHQREEKADKLEKKVDSIKKLTRDKVQPMAAFLREGYDYVKEELNFLAETTFTDEMHDEIERIHSELVRIASYKTTPSKRMSQEIEGGQQSNKDGGDKSHTEEATGLELSPAQGEEGEWDRIQDADRPSDDQASSEYGGHAYYEGEQAGAAQEGEDEENENRSSTEKEYSNADDAPQEYDGAGESANLDKSFTSETQEGELAGQRQNSSELNSADEDFAFQDSESEDEEEEYF